MFRNLRRAIPGKKKTQKRIKELFEKNKIEEVLTRIKRMIRMIGSRKQKGKLIEFYSYVLGNPQGIEASMQLRVDKDIENAGAIEPTIDKLIAHRFKGRGMSWSEEGAQALLKIRQTIVNNEREDFWYKKRGKKIEIRALFN